jgi:serine phosphatase RsbU (regulator of sigma subunit)
LDGEEFGEDRLTAVLRQNSTSDATSLQEKVMHNVREFCEGNFHDDATVVVLAVTG